MAVNYDRLNKLLNKLSDKDLQLVTNLMERLVENNNKTGIPLDDEPTTQEDFDAIKAAHEAYKKDELIDLKDIENELRS